MQIENKNLETAISFVVLTLTMFITRYLGIFAMPFVLGAYLMNSIENKDGFAWCLGNIFRAGVYI